MQTIFCPRDFSIYLDYSYLCSALLLFVYQRRLSFLIFYDFLFDIFNCIIMWTIFLAAQFFHILGLFLLLFYFLIVQEVFLFCLSVMPVKLDQYRGTAEVLDYHKFGFEQAKACIVALYFNILIYIFSCYCIFLYLIDLFKYRNEFSLKFQILTQ